MLSKFGKSHFVWTMKYSLRLFRRFQKKEILELNI